MIQALQKYVILDKVIERCNDVVVKRLGENKHTEASIALESFNNGGKRLRPALLVLSAMAPNGGDIGDPDATLLDLAGAVELIHLATLFHDDVIDDVDHRRKKQSARLKYGNYASVLTGDYALAEALELVQRSGHPEVMPEFIRALRVLVRGESLEMQHKYDYNLNEAEYSDIISEKSASLFALSCKVGAMCKSPEFADTMGNFGWNLGMAFQMIDDLDDMLDNPNKSYDCDLRNGYLSLPMIRVFGNLRNAHREELIQMIEAADFSPKNERFIVSLCMEYRGIEYAHERIVGQLTKASQSLERFSEGQAHDLLRNVVSDLTTYADNQVDNFTRFLAEPAA